MSVKKQMQQSLNENFPVDVYPKEWVEVIESELNKADQYLINSAYRRCV